MTMDLNKLGLFFFLNEQVKKTQNLICNMCKTKASVEIDKGMAECSYGSNVVAENGLKWFSEFFTGVLRVFTGPFMYE